MQGAKAAKENLARAKAYFQRHEVLRCIEAVVLALQAVQGGVTGTDKLAVDSALREIMTLLSRTEEVRHYFPKGLAFQPGTEKPLLRALSQMLERIRAAQLRESYTQTLERKQKLDKLLGYGKKLLEAGKVADADGAFAEAVECYVDEHVLFRMIGEACLAAKQPRMAAKYLKRGVKVDPLPKRTGALLVRALEESGNIPAARKLQADMGL